MEYRNNVTFAIRTVLIYKRSKDNFPEYKFTLVSGALLNVFSAICPDETFLIKLDSLSQKKIPSLPNPSVEEITIYLKNIRNSLAHKTQNNFTDYFLGESNQIYELQITSKHNEIFRFTIDDLELILYLIDEEMRIQEKDLYISEEEAFTNCFK